MAGTGVPGFSGDGGPPAEAQLDDPTGLAVDAAGDLLIADTANCRVRLVAASDGTRFGVPVVRGHIYTVAGNGICGSAGDGGPAPTPRSGTRGRWPWTPAGTSWWPTRATGPSGCWPPTPGTFYGVPLAADDLGTVAGEGSYGPYLVDGLPAVGETGELNFPTGIAVDGRRRPLHRRRRHARHPARPRRAPTTLLGQPAQAGRHVHGGRRHVAPGSLRDGTTWIQTRLLDPAGLALSPGGAPRLQRQPGRRGAGAAGRQLTPVPAGQPADTARS